MDDQGFNRVIWAARRAGRALDIAKEQQLRHLEMHAAHYALLSAVSAHRGATGAELARELSVTPQNVASLANRLEQRGLIERKANPRHQNIVEMWITGPGEELLAEADTAMIDLERRIAGFLGIKQTERLRSLLEALADGLERENKEFRGPSAEASKRD